MRFRWLTAALFALLPAVAEAQLPSPSYLNLTVTGAFSPGRWTTAARPLPTTLVPFPFGLNTDTGIDEQWNGQEWVPSSVTPGGSSGQLQLNVNGAFVGAPIGAGLVLDPTSHSLSATGTGPGGTSGQVQVNLNNQFAGVATGTTGSGVILQTGVNGLLDPTVLPIGTTSQAGAFKIDGTTVTATNGTISVPLAGRVGSVSDGTNTVTAPSNLVISGATVSGSGSTATIAISGNAGGTVTGVTGSTANGLVVTTGSNPTTTPQITVGTALTGLLKGANGGLATAGAGDVTGTLGYTPLATVNNLSDLTNVATARTNLGLAASATIDTTNAANILSGVLAAARLPTPTGSTLGGVQSGFGSVNQWMTGINNSGVPQFSQMSFANLSGSPTQQQITNGLGFTPLAQNGSGAALTGLTWSQIGSTPTTLNGYGITNGLVTSNNLSDLTSASAARGNLGLGAIATQAVPNGIAKGNGTALSAAVAGTDYLTPTSSLAGNTGLPVAGISGLGTNVASALGATLNSTNGLAPTTSPAFNGATPTASRIPMLADSYVSSMDSSLAGTTVYGDAFTFDTPACYSDGNASFCQNAATSSNASGNTINVNTLPAYIAASGVNVTGAGISGTASVTSFTGTPGGAGTVTLNQAPSSVGSINFSPPANVIQFTESGTMSQTVTAVQGSNTITFGTGFCTTEMVGSPLSVPGAGVGGGALNTTITGCQNVTTGSPSAVVGIKDQVGTSLSGTTETIAYGANFVSSCPGGTFGSSGTTGCVGMGMLAESWNGGGGGGPSAIPVTITTVYSPSVIAVGTAGTQIIQSSNRRFVVGHDDSTAVNTVCSQGVARGVRYLLVPAHHYVPNISRMCEQMLIRGAGSLTSGAALRTLAISGQLPLVPDPVVVPFTAPMPSPPRPAAFPVSLQLFSSVWNPTMISTYDSLSGPEPNGISDVGTYPYAFITAIKRQNPGFPFQVQYPGITGGTLQGVFQAAPTLTNPPCVTSTSIVWIQQVSTNCPGQLWTIGTATNDATGMSQQNLLQVQQQLRGQGYGNFFTTPRDLIFYTAHPQTRINSGAISNQPTEVNSEYGSGVMCSYADVMGFPCIDVEAEGQKHVWGYDPTRMGQERAYDVPYSTGLVGLPWSYGRNTYGFGLTFGKSSTTPAAFWATMTGSGATDPRGNGFVFFNIGPTSTFGFARVWLFYNSGTGVIGLECDAQTNMPGIGCDDPATGKPPVTAANPLDSITVANSGSGGVAVVTLATQTFVWNGAPVSTGNCPTGQTVTIANAGTAVTPNGGATYHAPDIDTIASCQSGSQITLSSAAPTPISNSTQFVFYGSPIITSGNIVDNGDGSGNEKIHFEVSGDRMIIWIGNSHQQLYAGYVMRPRQLFQPAMQSGGNRPSILVWGDALSGNTTFTVSKIMPNVTDFTDNEVVGPAAVTPYSNATYMSSESGDGYAHPTTRFVQDVVQPAFDAQNFSIGNGNAQISATTTSSVPSCLVGRVNVNDASASTITLPAWCANPITVMDAGGHAASATITIAIANGGTVNGASTITTNYGNRTVRYTANGVAASQ